MFPLRIRVLLIFLLLISVELLGEKEKLFNLKFTQNDYKLKWEWAEITRVNKRYVTIFKQNVFKYNRTCTAGNLTFEYKVDVDNTLEIVLQAYKFASNEYRLFPLRFQVNFCVAMNKNLVGGQTMNDCGNYTSCTTPKGVRIHICNWVPNESKFPPYIPSGRYKVEYQGIYYDQELFMGAYYGEIYRPFVGK